MPGIDYEQAKKAILASRSIDDLADEQRPPVPKCDEEQNYIFISYSHKDYKAVYCDLWELYREGVRYWYDSGLPAGEEWDLVVESKIKSPSCAGVIFYMSENLFLSKSIHKEIEYTVSGADGEEAKNHFGINLSGMPPMKMIHGIQQANSYERLDESGFYERMPHLMKAFGNKTTYINKVTVTDRKHISQTVRQIIDRFGMIDFDACVNDGEMVEKLQTELDLVKNQLALARNFKIKGNVLIRYLGDGEEVTIPDNITIIGKEAFGNCEKIKTVFLPSSVAEIGDFAFYGCPSLTGVNISGGVTEIGKFAFHLCINITSMNIPGSVAKIGVSAFSYCTRLESITYNGTKSMWYKLNKEYEWDKGTPDYVIRCTDGDIQKGEAYDA